MKLGETAQRTRRIEEDDIRTFAAIAGDFNPVHFDPDLAARSKFGGIVVQCGITSGLLNALVAQDGQNAVLPTTCA